MSFVTRQKDESAVIAENIQNPSSESADNGTQEKTTALALQGSPF